LKEGAKVNAQEEECCEDGHAGFGTALVSASLSGHEEVVRLLLSRGANVHARGDYAADPLQAASLHGHTQVVQLLLENGADVNARSGYFGNGLEGALRGGHEAATRRPRAGGTAA